MGRPRPSFRDGKKVCCTCKSELDVSMFGKRSSYWDGLRTECKKCEKARRDELAAARSARMTKENVMASNYSKECSSCACIKPASGFYYNPKISDCLTSRCRACCRMEHRRRSENMSEEQIIARRASSRKSKLKNKYGMSVEDHNVLSSYQSHRCYICGAEELGISGGRELCADHDHSSGAPRGLLCWDCNVGLGRFKDSRDLLDRAIEYLDLPPWQRMKESAVSRVEVA